MAEDGFAVAVYREGGRWDCALLPPAVLDDLDTCVAVAAPAAVRGRPDRAGRRRRRVLRRAPARAGRVRVLLSDITAAEEFTIARQALDRAGGDLDEAPSDPEEVWPAGDLGIFRDLGLDERELGLILDDVDLWADEMLSAIADRIGVGAEFARVLDTLQPAD